MKLKIFIAKISILTILLISTYFIAVRKVTQGPVDHYYSKFTYKSGSIIIGLSRTIFGVAPSVIEREFNNINKPVLNFGFDRARSPFGETLLNSIKHKIDTSSKNGLYIISVSPASFFITNSKNENAIINMEKGMDKMTQFNSNPNYEYIRKYYEEPLYKGLYDGKISLKKAHKDGWVEFKSNLGGNYSVSEKQIKYWKEETLLGYKQVAENQVKSEYRIKKFNELISFLKKFGSVIIVRLPLDNDFIILENSFWKTFDIDIDIITKKHNIPYFNYSTSDKKYDTFDGSHLFGYSAKEFTKDLCDDIKSYQKNRSKED